MTDSGLERARSLFDRALLVPGPDRASFVRREAGENSELAEMVLALLAEHDGAVSFGAPPGGVDGITTPAPSTIGAFRILGVLGEGGMGVVYEAEQSRPQRRVALKVVRPGLASAQALRRFEHEAEILGRLQHPGIAQVYEAGTATTALGSSPYFAMELVQGVSLTRYVQEHHLGTRDRLALVVKICEAVQHAHQKGVIHRDLKPGNILVDATGQPKVLDFGVARLTDSDIQTTTMRTDIGQLIGTVPYMSPEQASGQAEDLDTRSDVYALGVIAYELLAGRLPYDVRQKLVHEAVRVIREDDPTPLSNVNKVFRGDVETIVGKALEKDKTRRYQSAGDLAADIGRYLHDEPIVARPAGTWYQASKFARRHKGLVGGVAAAFVLLVAGLAGTTYGLRQAIAARNSEALAKNAAVAAQIAEAEQRRVAQDNANLAKSQRDVARRTAEFMSDTLSGVSPAIALGRDTTLLKEMMDTAAARIENGELKDAPEAEIRLRETIGQVYSELPLYEAAEKMLASALVLARSVHPGDHEDIASALNNLGNLFNRTGNFEKAEPLLREAVAMSKRLIPDGYIELATRINNLGITVLGRGDPEGAESLFREAIAIWQRLQPEGHPNLAKALSSLGMILEDRGDLLGAESLLRQAVEMSRRFSPQGDPAAAVHLNNLGALLLSRGDLSAAEALFRANLAMQRKFYSGDHEEIAGSIANVGQVLLQRGDQEGAEFHFRQAVDMLRRLFPNGTEEEAVALGNLASLIGSRGNLNEAEALLGELIDIRRRLSPRESPGVADGLLRLALVINKNKDYARAAPYFREAAEMFEHVRGKNFWVAGFARGGLGHALAQSGRFSEAESELLNAEHVLSLQDVPAGRHEACVAALVSLYDSWDKAEPGKGYDAKAAEWKLKLDIADGPKTSGTASQDKK